MIQNTSPWIHQLKRVRPGYSLLDNESTDVVIVGAGIAGVVTAFFTLRDTDHKVILVDADRVAHGATGHNAGQITSYFERPLSELVEAYGLSLAIDAQRSVESAWSLIDDIMRETALDVPLYRFTGYAGLSTKEQIIKHVNDSYYRVEGGLPQETLIISESWEGLSSLDAKYEGLYGVAPMQDVLSLLETDSTEYIACLSYQKGCMNSAAFSEALVSYLLATYKDRFHLYEHTPVSVIDLYDGHALCTVESGCTIQSSFVVLCTNGFEHFSIINHSGRDIDTEFHHLIAGRIGYMSGYIAHMNHPPTAISYFPAPKESYSDSDPTGENYFYLTRRPHVQEGTDEVCNLVCVGGPDMALPNDATYDKTESCSEEAHMAIDDFLSKHYNKHPKKDIEYSFCWHGLMGYTPNTLRRIGFEPKQRRLLYNLGCNGVGILPSIFGGHRIAQLLQGVLLPVSLFDIQDQEW